MSLRFITTFFFLSLISHNLISNELTIFSNTSNKINNFYNFQDSINSLILKNSFYPINPANLLNYNNSVDPTNSKDSKNSLSEKWKKWLEEEVVYITSPKEKEIFLSLKSDRERETFVEAFWLQRDPTPGTPANEFKEEHYRRIEYVNKFLGRDTVRPGWMTDRGRVYIVLGEPMEIQRYETYQNIYPAELWYYHGDTSLGFPPYFYILFYKDKGIGEYKLYSPAGDGPEKLIVPSLSLNSQNRAEIYYEIKQVSSELASASLSLIPGEGVDPAGMFQSLSSDILLSNVFHSPIKKIDSQWAEKFLKYKEIITTDYSVKYVRSNHSTFLHQMDGKNFLHIIVEPYTLNLNQYENKVFAPLKINIKITDLNGKIIFQDEKDFSVEFTEENFKKIERRIPALGDLIPIIDGNFTLNFLIRNTASKEFTSFEEKIYSPKKSPYSIISPVLFLYNEKSLQKKNNNLIPFNINNSQLYPNSQKNYTPDEELIFFFEIYNFNEDIKNKEMRIQIEKDGKVLKDIYERISGSPIFLKKIPLKEFPPSEYKLKISVLDKNNEILSQLADFNVLPVASVPRPWNYSKIYPDINHPYFSLIRSYQLINSGRYDEAIQEIEKFYRKEKPHPDIAICLSKAYFYKNNFEKTIQTLLPLKEMENLELNIILGKSFLNLKNYNEAIFHFKKAINIGGETIELLNSLGICFYETGKKDESIKYFQKSLSLNPDQKEIKLFLEKIK
ncbi:MAG: GWxTD domain-containing protein [Acidobacteriota bacterium]